MENGPLKVSGTLRCCSAERGGNVSGGGGVCFDTQLFGVSERFPGFPLRLFFFLPADQSVLFG